jgi:hypothetical protein
MDQPHESKNLYMIRLLNGDSVILRATSKD